VAEARVANPVAGALVAGALAAVTLLAAVPGEAEVKEAERVGAYRLIRRRSSKVHDFGFARRLGAPHPVLSVTS